MAAKLPLNPRHPERICWGCDKYCPADDLACGNGTIRTQHPAELFGEDWLAWSEARSARNGSTADEGRAAEEEHDRLDDVQPLESCRP